MSQYTSFFLRNVRSKPNATPLEMYRYFYKLIQQDQVNEMIILKKALDIIDNNIRIISVATDDEVKLTIIREQTALLLKIAQEIRDTNTTPGDNFLESLNTVLKYKSPL